MVKRHSDELHRLIEDEADETKILELDLRQETTKQCRIMFLTIFSLLTFVFLGLALMVRNHSNASISTAESINYVTHEPCGKSPGEARRRGCHFDVNSFSWFHPTCWDPELSAEPGVHREWEWFLDQNGTQPIGRDLVETGKYTELYVSWEYHLRQCVLVWKKMHRTLVGRRPSRIASSIGNYFHMVHCESVDEAKARKMGEKKSLIRVKFPDCKPSND